MRYFVDTEFMERPGSIELLSLALVDEHGRTYYIENADAEHSHANPWVQENVLPHLWGGATAIPHAQIGQEVLAFIGVDSEPEFWGYYCAYDYVVVSWLFGGMAGWPDGWPMYFRDLKQWGDQLGITQWPDSPQGEHNALADAGWNRDLWTTLDRVERARTQHHPGPIA